MTPVASIPVAPPIAATDLPGQNPLRIGPVTFNSVECPSALPIGGLEQRLAVTELLGGGKDTQSLGVQPKNVSWRGGLWQPNISARKTALRAMMVSRAEYPLTWMDEHYLCKVKSFQPTANHANRCEYEIELEITRATNGALTSTSVPTVDQQISALTGSVQAQNTTIVTADSTGSQAFQKALSTALADLRIAGPIAQIVAPQSTTIIASLQAAISSVSAYASSVSEGASQYVAAQQLIASLSLILTNVQRGQMTQTVRVQGISLFELASQYYGDPSLAFALAEVNGLPSPHTSSKVSTVISLPPYPKAS